MKAFLLAAGLGTRLRPYTDEVPKCLVPINGKPLLEIWFELLELHGVREVLVNTHYHAEKVMDFVKNYKKGNLEIILSYEENLAGSAGTVFKNREFVSDGRPFIVAYADNLTNADISGLYDFYVEKALYGSLLAMGLIKTNEPKSCGIVTIGTNGLITDFIEKPENPVSDLANCGIYITDEKIFSFFPEFPDKNGILDFGFDILPKLKGRMSGYKIEGYLRDVGTVGSYLSACAEWPPEQK